jgi:CubicO group peptidase (beta-lactamase class C family)
MLPEPGPEVQGVPVTARNWQDPPANRWAFWHVGEILPTYRVSRGDGPVRELPPAPPAVDDRGGLLAAAVTRADRSPGTVGEVLTDTFTDAYLVLQDGQLVTEWYGPLGAPDRPHALMSVSKSVVGCVAAVLIDRGQLDPDREITGYVPELAASGYAGALVRHVYDMRSGVRFVEEYANPHADIRRLDEWIGGRESAEPGQGEPRGLYRFLATLPAEAPHGERFLYRSAESDVLGWVCERAAGRPMAALMSELIWAPMGAEHDATLLHDGLGTAVHDGGLSATARDVARFGQMLLDGGLVPEPAESRGPAEPRTGPAAAAGWCRRSGSAGPGPWTPTPGPCSPRRPPSRPFPAGGTGTSSGSAQATTATCCSASASTARCCTSAGARTRSA